jgi:hypothetical protein
VSSKKVSKSGAQTLQEAVRLLKIKIKGQGKERKKRPYNFHN